VFFCTWLYLGGFRKIKTGLGAPASVIRRNRKGRKGDAAAGDVEKEGWADERV